MLGPTQTTGWAPPAGLTNTSTNSYLVFPGGLPSRYWPGSALLSFCGQPVLGCRVIWLWVRRWWSLYCWLPQCRNFFSFCLLCYQSVLFPVCEKSMLVQTTIKARGMTSWLPRVIFSLAFCFMFLFHITNWCPNGWIHTDHLSFSSTGIFAFLTLFLEEDFHCCVAATRPLTVGTMQSPCDWFPGTVCFFDWLLIFSLWIGRLWTVLRVYVDFWMLFRHFCPMDHWTVNWGIYVAVRRELNTPLDIITQPNCDETDEPGIPYPESLIMLGPFGLEAMPKGRSITTRDVDLLLTLWMSW